MSRGDAVIDATAVYRVEANNSTTARREPNFNRIKNLVTRELGFGKLVFDGSPGRGLTDSLAGSERHQGLSFGQFSQKFDSSVQGFIGRCKTDSKVRIPVTEDIAWNDQQST